MLSTGVTLGVDDVPGKRQPDASALHPCWASGAQTGMDARRLDRGQGASEHAAGIPVRVEISRFCRRKHQTLQNQLSIALAEVSAVCAGAVDRRPKFAEAFARRP
jgi:hypothetical protein